MPTTVHRRLCCGCSTSAVLFIMGAVALVYAVIDLVNHDQPRCGKSGRPPLRDWLLGTGISFIAIAFSYGAAANGTAGGLCGFISCASNLFLMSWAIVGSISFWREGKDCEFIDKTLWQVSYAAIVINWIVVLCGCAVVFESKDEMMGKQADENV